MTTYRLKATEDAILDAVASYHYLTNAQLTRLLHQGKSETTVAERTKRLWEGTYLSRQHLSHRGRGSGALVYSLGPLGRKYLASIGYELPRYRIETKSDMHLRHTLAVSDVLIAFAKLGVEAFLHEQDLKRMSLPAYPDGWVRTSDTAYLLELDRSTEKQTRWSEKIQGLLPFLYDQRLLEAFFGVGYLGAILIVTPDNARRTTLRLWTDATLRRLNETAVADYFLYLTLDEATDPGTLASVL